MTPRFLQSRSISELVAIKALMCNFSPHRLQQSGSISKMRFIRLRQGYGGTSASGPTLGRLLKHFVSQHSVLWLKHLLPAPLELVPIVIDQPVQNARFRAAPCSLQLIPFGSPAISRLERPTEAVQRNPDLTDRLRVGCRQRYCCRCGARKNSFWHRDLRRPRQRSSSP